MNELNEPVEIPIEDTLDLHTFHPKEVREVLAEYLYQCRCRGILEVRIIHGRGIGVQRSIVRAYLAEQDWVLELADAPAGSGGWGATLVKIAPLSPTLS